MRYTGLLILPALFFLTISPATTEQWPVASESSRTSEEYSVLIDTTPRVTGIGGVFFESDNPGQAREWYARNLGLVINDYGSTFEFRNANRPEEVNYLQWSPFRKGSSYFAPSKNGLMINYRVQNLEGLIRNLKANGVTILDTLESYDYGKFIHILDAEGNKVELWEPVDSVLTRMGGQTTR